MKRFTFFSLMMLFAAGILLSGHSSVMATDVANIGELREQPIDETEYVVTGEVVITHMHGQRNQKYIQDDTGAIVIDDPDGIITTEYNLYDGITGISGTLSVYQNLLQFTPTADPGPATSTDNVIEPLLITLDEILPSHQAMLIRVNGVEFTGGPETFTPSTNYDIADASGTGLLRTPSQSAELDYFGTDVPVGNNDMLALVSQFGDVMQIFPRSLTDFYPDGVPAYSVTFSVLDENNDPITDAVVTFDGQTLPAGEYMIEEVDAGGYDYSVEKTGFYTRNGQVAVSGDDVVVTVIMVAVDPNAVNNFPWTEDFEGDFPPAVFNHYAYGAGGWATAEPGYEGGQTAFHAFSADYADSWLVSPQVQLPEDQGMLLNFFQRNSFMVNYEEGVSLSAVMISTGSGNPEHEEFEMVYESASGIEDFSERTVNLGDFAGEVVYIAFVYKGEASHNWYVDNVTIEEAPSAIEVSNIAELYDMETGDLIYFITGEAVITHMHGQRNQKYIQDDTGAIVIDDPDGIITTEYNLYDGITGISGTLSVYNNLLQFSPTEDPGPATSTDNTIEPLLLTLADLQPEHQSMLIRVNGVEFTGEEETFTPSTSFDIADASGSSVLRTPSQSAELDYFDTAVPESAIDLVAMVSQFGDAMQIFPRSLADFLEPNSVQEFEAAGFTVYPNPARDVVTINGENTIDEVKIYSINGQLVQQQTVNGQQVSIQAEGLKTGMYIVQIVSGSTVMNYKLQIQK